MADNGRLELEFVDVNGNRLTEPVDFELRHHVLSQHRRFQSVDASRPVGVEGLRTEPQGLYRLEVEAPSYWPLSRFVTIPASGSTREVITLPIRPDRARGVFPAHDQLDERVKGVLDRSRGVRRLEGLSGRALYEALSEEAKGGLLNIAKKSLATAFTNGADLLPHVTLLDIVGDRCFVEVPPALKDQMPTLVRDELFRIVDGGLHEAPDGFTRTGSFKTLDAFGNLQITFFQNGANWRADVDIDDAAGLLHVFQVARNRLTGNPTHPFNIHQILVWHQHLDPGYRLLPRG